MNTLITILNKPNTTFEYLGKKYEDVLNPDYDMIFMALGAFTGFVSFLSDYKSITSFIDIHPAVIGLFFVLLGVGIALVLGKHIIAPLTYLIGKALKGQADQEQIRLAIAYSWVPLFFKIPFDIYYSVTDSTITELENWIFAGIGILLYLWAVKIEILGLMVFNKYGFIKAIINKLPFLILQVGYLYKGLRL